MFDKMKRPFGTQSISKIVYHFYGIAQLCLIFIIFSLPWILTNMFLKYTPLTGFIYAITGVLLFPNLQALILGIDGLYAQDEQQKLKQYFQLFIGCWRDQTKKTWLGNSVIVLGLMVYVSEFYLIMQHNELRFMIIPFIILGTFFGGMIVNYLFIDSFRGPSMSFRKQVYLACYLSWRKVILTILITGVLALWLSAGYSTPILNILLGNVVTFWLLYKLSYRSVRHALKLYYKI